MLSRIRNKLLDSAWLSMGYASFNQLPEGISFAGGQYPGDVELLKDFTYIDNQGTRHTRQEIFDAIFDAIRNARELILLDMFLFNDFQGNQREETRKLSSELTNLLIQQKEQFPDLTVILITDPINTMYGGISSEPFGELCAAGIQLVTTDLDKLRDSNPMYSFFWRLLIRPFGISPGGIWPSPFGDDRIPFRSYLKLLNFKANHRKTVITDNGEDWIGIVATGNPHDASSAHRNVAIKFNGPAVRDLYTSELAVLAISAAAKPDIHINQGLERFGAKPKLDNDVSVQVVTEKQIKIAVLEAINVAQSGSTIDLILFYLSDRDIIIALKAASAHGVKIRLILDPNKDAFGIKKTGIPNRPAAYDLQDTNIKIRWAFTHGEQCHSKMLISIHSNDCSLILGSANFTRRNLEDFNLETDVVVRAPKNTTIIKESQAMFNLIWNNEENKIFSAEYDLYRDEGRFRYWLYRLMELTGISTF
jgi:phosphatidylserine/phosphatidylglycerophosphate/cardiolipin synthase-like enzyme